MVNNKGGALDPKQVKGFTTLQAMDDFILTNQGNVLTGVILDSPSPDATTFVLQVSQTEIGSQGLYAKNMKLVGLASVTCRRRRGKRR